MSERPHVFLAGDSVADVTNVERTLRAAIPGLVVERVDTAAAVKPALSNWALSGAFDAAQREVLQQIAMGAPLQASLDRIVRMVEQQGSGLLGSLLLLDRAEGRIRHASAPSLPAEFNAAIDGALIGPEVGSCGAAAYFKQRVVVEDIAAHPNWRSWRELALRHGLCACWSSPILSPEREVLGTFAIYYRNNRGPTARELEWIEAATQVAAIAIMRHESEQALRRSEARYRHMVDTAFEGIWRLDAEGRTTFANRRMAEMLGCTPGELIGRSVYEMLDEDAVEEARSQFARRMHGVSEQYDLRIRRRDGSFFWAIVSASPALDDAGRVIGALAMVTDISARKAAEARGERLARLYAVSSSVSELIVRVREIETLYEQACRIPVEQGLLRLAWIGLLRELDRAVVPVARSGHDAGFIDGVLPAINGEREAVGPAARALASGVAVVVRDIANDPTFDHAEQALARGLLSCGFFPIRIQGKPEGFFAVYADQRDYFDEEEVRVFVALADDIGFAVESARRELDRQRWESALRQSEAEFRLMFDCAGVGIALVDESGRPVRCNGTLTRMLGYPEAELRNYSFDELTHPDDLSRDSRANLEMLTREREHYQVVRRYIKKDGTVIWSRLTLSMVQERGVGARLAIAMMEDVSEQRRAEEALGHAQRMQSIGTLAGGIAHDFNNILMAIGGNAQLALFDLPAGHGARQSIQEIQAASARAAELVRQILTFSRQQEPRRTRLQLAPVVEEALRLLRATLPAMIEIKTRFSPSLPPVMADATQIHQVVMNLATNAAHAMREGRGVLTIGLDRARVQPADHSADLPSGSYVRLSVIDTGTGIDEATLQRMFEPFFSTKPTGQGTGLGLSVVHGIVKSHGAALQVQSRPGEGTRFEIYFHAVEGVLDAPEPRRADGLGDGQRILYVDDEVALVSLATRTLERLGYRVVGFTDALAALEAFRASPGVFDAVVTDYSMPGMTGVELARELRRLRPGLPIVMTTGFATPDAIGAAATVGVSRVVHKPARVEELASTLRELLGTDAKD